MAEGRTDEDVTGARWDDRGNRNRSWDWRLARSSNFLQLCRDDLCGKMKTLKARRRMTSAMLCLSSKRR